MNATQMNREATLAPGLTTRPVRLSDAQAVADLTVAVCTADGDPTIAQTRADLERFWKLPGVNPETDGWVVEAADGRIVGYEEFFNRHAHAVLVGDGYVHPDFHGLGIGTSMLRRLCGRARQEAERAEPGLRVHLRNQMVTTDKDGEAIHAAEGFRPIRYSRRMEIALREDQVPHWPSGVELRPFDKQRHDRLLFEADDLAFSGHFGHTPGTYELWQQAVSGREDFDPDLWYVAWGGEQIAGYALCRFRQGIGWVGDLGVLPAWRRQGLGSALLLHAFSGFWRRGMQTVSLGVDAENTTGATRLYERAGMRIASETVTYELELRPGRELSVED